MTGRHVFKPRDRQGHGGGEDHGSLGRGSGTGLATESPVAPRAPRPEPEPRARVTRVRASSDRRTPHAPRGRGRQHRDGGERARRRRSHDRAGDVEQMSRVPCDHGKRISPRRADPTARRPLEPRPYVAGGGAERKRTPISRVSRVRVRDHAVEAHAADHAMTQRGVNSRVVNFAVASDARALLHRAAANRAHPDASRTAMPAASPSNRAPPTASRQIHVVDSVPCLVRDMRGREVELREGGFRVPCQDSLAIPPTVCRWVCVRIALARRCACHPCRPGTRLRSAS